jgi:acetyl esterase/lipase
MDLDAVVFAPAPPPLAEVRDERVSERVRVRIYRPHGAARPVPAVVYLHGGGFVLGGLDVARPLCRALAHDARCVVVSVDYRLAPEHPFPAAADDATAAFRWVIAEAARLGVDPGASPSAGDSAGGNLAAVVANDTRDDEHPPCLQALIYPAVDSDDVDPSHAQDHGAGLPARPRDHPLVSRAVRARPGDWTKPRGVAVVRRREVRGPGAGADRGLRPAARRGRRPTPRSCATGACRSPRALPQPGARVHQHHGVDRRGARALGRPGGRAAEGVPMSGVIPLARGTKVVVMTGAGISAESGIRTFRDGNGLWEEHRVEDVASPEGWERDPALVWRFYSERRAQALTVQPNPAHRALAALDRRQPRPDPRAGRAGTTSRTSASRSRSAG